MGWKRTRKRSARQSAFDCYQPPALGLPLWKEREREKTVCVCACVSTALLFLFLLYTALRVAPFSISLSLSLSTADSMHKSTWYVSFVIYTWNRYTIKSFLILLLPPVSFSPFFLFSKRYITPCLLPLRLPIPLFSRFPNTLMETNRPLRDQSRQWFSPLLPSFHFSPSKIKWNESKQFSFLRWLTRMLILSYRVLVDLSSIPK